MEHYTINYEIIYRGKYNRNLINVKFIQNRYIIFNFETLYSRFYEMFVQNYNSDYYYCQLSQNFEIELENIDEDKIINFILSTNTNDVNDDFNCKNKINFYAKLNEEFHHFLDTLKINHCKVIKNSKW